MSPGGVENCLGHIIGKKHHRFDFNAGNLEFVGDIAQRLIASLLGIGFVFIIFMEMGDVNHQHTGIKATSQIRNGGSHLFGGLERTYSNENTATTHQITTFPMLGVKPFRSITTG
jgi:hypothetical protein